MALEERRLVGLIGSNILQSLSPALHEDAFAAAGMVGHYHLMDVDALPGRSLDDLLNAARTSGFSGVNVTFPFKEKVIALLDEVSPEAREIGAVNTVVIERSGRTTGHNTDRSGFRRAFAEVIGAERVYGKAVLLIGAGGAGRAVAFGLRDLGCTELRVHDQDRDRSQRLCAELAGLGTPIEHTEPALADVAGVVNATPVGMTGHPGLPMPTDRIEARHFVADVVYTPIDTAFVLAARAKGCATMNGGGMCVHQAAEAFRLFTGRIADVARMKRTFAEACGRRG